MKLVTPARLPSTDVQGLPPLENVKQELVRVAGQQAQTESEVSSAMAAVKIAQKVASMAATKAKAFTPFHETLAYFLMWFFWQKLDPTCRSQGDFQHKHCSGLSLTQLQENAIYTMMHWRIKTTFHHDDAEFKLKVGSCQVLKRIFTLDLGRVVGAYRAAMGDKTTQPTVQQVRAGIAAQHGKMQKARAPAASKDSRGRAGKRSSTGWTPEAARTKKAKVADAAAATVRGADDAAADAARGAVDDDAVVDAPPHVSTPHRATAQAAPAPVATPLTAAGSTTCDDGTLDAPRVAQDQDQVVKPRSRAPTSRPAQAPAVADASSLHGSGAFEAAGTAPDGGACMGRVGAGAEIDALLETWSRRAMEHNTVLVMLCPQTSETGLMVPAGMRKEALAAAACSVMAYQLVTTRSLSCACDAVDRELKVSPGTMHGLVHALDWYPRLHAMC